MPNLLFYDGNCPLCSREIRLLERYKDDHLSLQNIHCVETSALAQPYSKADLLAVLHLKTEHGAWLTGLDATVTAWQHTRVGFLLKPLRWPVIAFIADWFYYRWATARVCKLSNSASKG